ncbi:hypothetical protein P4C99_08260 [Pontiellaceae bacterium B1224]|nr:hypothetical protein [Pontiellaceae bacterium B1224]
MSAGAGLAAEADSSGSAKYKFGEPLHLLDGYSLNYQYQSGKALHMEFDDGKGKYEWLTGPRKGTGKQDIPYRCRKIGNDLYIINWHQTDIKDYLTLVFDFENMVVYSSIIIGYEDKPERPRRTTFEAGIIERLKRPE